MICRNVFKIVACCAIIVLLQACGAGEPKYYTKDAESFKKLTALLNDKFGEDAYYTKLNVANDDVIGSVINLSVTNDPASKKMIEVNRANGFWNETADVTLTITGGEAVDFMFNINKDCNMELFAGLIEQSKQKLIKEHDLTSPKVEMVSIIGPTRGVKSEMKYYISLQPENGGTSFTFQYDMNGKETYFDF